MNRAQAVLSAINVEIATILWMVVEGGVSLAAGLASNSVALTAFGIDSVIELITAVVLLWRLRVERIHGPTEHVARAERRAAWIVGFALLFLCLYIVGESVMSVVTGEHSESSLVGIVISACAILVMPLLAAKKIRLARELQSASLRGDAMCSVSCAYMAGALLVGLVVQWLTGWWWLDGIIALSLLYWLIPETKAAFAGARKGTLDCGCDTECA